MWTLIILVVLSFRDEPYHQMEIQEVGGFSTEAVCDAAGHKLQDKPVDIPFKARNTRSGGLFSSKPVNGEYTREMSAVWDYTCIEVK